jgi:ribonuclease Z
MLFAESAKIAADGNVKRLVLTHFSPSIDDPTQFLANATKVFPNTIIGYDGLTMTLNYAN